jgi:2,3-bisphosphoglycerate-independent phosphoglycerate mutase
MHTSGDDRLPPECTESRVIELPKNAAGGCRCRYYRGRGAFESMGAGLPMAPGDIAFKSNFATRGAAPPLAQSLSDRWQMCYCDLLTIVCPSPDQGQ